MAIALLSPGREVRAGRELQPSWGEGVGRCPATPSCCPPREKERVRRGSCCPAGREGPGVEVAVRILSRDLCSELAGERK